MTCDTVRLVEGVVQVSFPCYVSVLLIVLPSGPEFESAKRQDDVKFVAGSVAVYYIYLEHIYSI